MFRELGLNKSLAWMVSGRPSPQSGLTMAFLATLDVYISLHLHTCSASCQPDLSAWGHHALAGRVPCGHHAQPMPHIETMGV